MHRHYSTRIFNDEFNRYRRALPPKELQRARDAIALHAHLDFNFIEDPLGSAMRIADHLMPFANHWAYPKLCEVKGGAELAESLWTAAKSTPLDGFESAKKKLWDAVNGHAGFSLNFKEDLLSGLRAVDRGAYVVDMAGWAGEFDGARYDAKSNLLEIAIRPAAERKGVQGVFDCGQDQFFYFLKKRGEHADLSAPEEPLNLRCREQGPVALRIFAGTLPQKKLNFKIRRPSERIRGAL
jgi:hypothetical protein